LDEALWHIGEAHIRACWLTIGKVKTLEELTMKSPESLVLLAEEIYDKMASRNACQRLWGSDGSPPKDQYLLQSIMFNMDVLTYFNLHEAINVGDVGRMEDLLPIMVYRFAGGGNPRYPVEVLELLQCLNKEWPDDVK
jgi:hypothetical protein